MSDICICDKFIKVLDEICRSVQVKYVPGFVVIDYT